MVFKKVLKLCLNQQDKERLQKLRDQIANEKCPDCSGQINDCDMCPYHKFQEARFDMRDAIDEILENAEEE